MPPQVQLKTTVIPTSLMRLAVLGDVMKNFGATDEQIRIAQQGLADGLMDRLTVNGRDGSGYIQDQVTLHFEQLARDVDLSLDGGGGRSMIEAVSLKLAHAVLYSVSLMRRKGLAISFLYGFTPKVSGDPRTLDQTLMRFGLQPCGEWEGFAPGYGPRQLFSITPGRDRGMHYAHVAAWRLG